jgi:hypothetical protein
MRTSSGYALPIMEGDMRKYLIAVLLVLSPQAYAACSDSDRPAVPVIFDNKPPYKISNRNVYQLSWGFQANKKLDDLLYWDISITRQPDGRVIYEGGGVGDGARHHGGNGGPATLYWNVDVKIHSRADNGQYCIAVKTRTEPGKEGCVSPGYPAIACKNIYVSARRVGRKIK